MDPLAVPDEGAHLYRDYLVADGVCTGVPAVTIPSIRENAHLDPREFDHHIFWRRLPPDAGGGEIVSQTDSAHGRPLPIVSPFHAVNLYSCVPYLPAGIAIGVSRIWNDSPRRLMYVGRFANLLFFLSMVVAAMRLLPGFALPIAVLALMPMSLHQAASLSADVVTNGIAFVLTAYILRLSITEDAGWLKRGEYLRLTVGFVLAGLCKSSAGLVFLLLLIPSKRFPSRRMQWLAITGFTVLAFGVAAAWQPLNRPNGEVYSTVKSALGIHVDENAALLVHRPAVFVSAVFRTIGEFGEEYLEEFVGKLGPLAIRLPVWLPWLYLVLLAAAAISVRAGPQLSGSQRCLLAAVFIGNAVSLFAVVWTTELSQKILGTYILAGRGAIPGLQGRYLIPFALLPLLAVSGAAADRVRAPRLAAAVAFSLVLGINLVALDCVWNYYQARRSTLPNRIRLALKLRFGHTPENLAALYDRRMISDGTPEAPAYLVSDGMKHRVPSKLAFAREGYRWPDDVLIVSAGDVMAIPSGNPLPAPKDYEGWLVTRSGGDGKVYVVRDGQKHWVWDPAWIRAQGYQWPGDLHTLAGSELGEIPEGAALP
jgi:uncharacterized membrane protein